MTTAGNKSLRFIDIGANLTDPVFRGVYHGKTKHSDDLNSVLQRAQQQGVQKIFITGGTLQESRHALDLANTKDELFATVGCHPTRCLEFEEKGMQPEEYLDALLQLILDNKRKVIAVGECGLDFDRLQFCPKDVQLKYFELQFALAEASGLPMFLHNRSTGPIMADILKRNRDRFKGGVIHSFDGTEQEAQTFLDLDLYIGINGCSLKTEENLRVLKTIPADRLLAETDAPWCDMRPTHASFKHIRTTFTERKTEKWDAAHTVKGRNEPARIVQVMEVMAAVRAEDVHDLADTVYSNTLKLFGLNG